LRAFPGIPKKCAPGMAQVNAARIGSGFGGQAMDIGCAARSAMPETEPATEIIPPLTSLTEEEAMLRDTVRQFAQQEIAPHVREMDEAQHLDTGILRQLFGLGLMAIEAPLELGGAGASFFSAVLAVEEISRVDPAVAVIVDVQNTLAVNALLRWGNAEQRRRWIPKMAESTVCAYALSEAGSGSDAFSLATQARADGELCAEWAQALDLKRYGGGSFSGVRNCESRGGLSGDHGFLAERGMAGFTRRAQGRQDGDSRVVDLRTACSTIAACRRRMWWARLARVTRLRLRR
jgi:hypothetical protein